MIPMPKRKMGRLLSTRFRVYAGTSGSVGNGVDKNRDDARHLVWIPAGAVKAWGNENITLILFKLGV